MELVQYRDTRRTKIVDLQAINGTAKVEIYLDLNVGQQKNLSQLVWEGFDKGVGAILVYIKDWNVGDENGSKLQITRENLEKVIDADDFMLLTAEIAGLTKEEFEQALEDGTLEEKIKKNITKSKTK